MSDFEYRVWVQYVLSADDYGVMRASASVLRADNPRLEAAPLKGVERAMQALEASGLIEKFEHQGVRYWWQTDWQDFQGVRYPRDTMHPQPTDDQLRCATEPTRKLFALRSVPSRQRLRNGSENVSETVTETSPLPVRAGGRETLTLTQTLQGSGSSKEIQISTAQPAWRQRGQGHGSLLAGEAFHRRNCAPWAFAACQRGVCIPKYDWPKWELRQPAEALQAFVEAWAERAASAGDAPEKFWPQAFTAHFGSAAPLPVTPQTKGARAVKAFDDAYDAIQAQKAIRP